MNLQFFSPIWLKYVLSEHSSDSSKHLEVINIHEYFKKGTPSFPFK